MFDQDALSGGFDDAPTGSARAFRAAMNAMARPGRIEAISGAKPPAPLSVAAGTLLLTLCDPETPVHLAPSVGDQVVRDWLTFHTGAPVVEPARAMFAVGAWDELLPLSQYSIGTPEYPDRSATLIVEVAELANSGAVLCGPGIKGQARLNLPAVDAFIRNAAQFPLGLDFYFTAEARLAALPRTTRVEAG